MGAEITVLSIIGGIIVIIAFFGKFISAQTKMSVQLTQVQVELAKLTELVAKRDKQVDQNTKDIFEIATNCRYIQENKKEVSK